MLDLEQAIEKFNTSLPRELQCEFASEEFMAALSAVGQRYGLDFVPLAILVAVGEVPYDDLVPYLSEELGVAADTAAGLAAELREKVFQPAIDRLRFLDANPNKAMTLDQQKTFAERIFTTGLLSELRHDPFIIGSVNARLFFILARDAAFAAVLERALYVNEETVSAAPIMLEGASVPPTVGNWLKAYLQQYGSEALDSVNQTNFLLNSANAKGLSSAERTLLARVIKTYINVKFFPDSMPSDDGSGWEILPGGDTPTGPVTPSRTAAARPAPSSVQRPVTAPAPVRSSRPAERVSSLVAQSSERALSARAQEPATPSRSAVRPKPSAPVAAPESAASVVAPSVRRPRPAPVQPQDRTPIRPAAPSAPRPAVASPVSVPAEPRPTAVSESTAQPESEELLNLKNMLLQYPAGSLERSAIEEEIRKLQNT